VSRIARWDFSDYLSPILVKEIRQGLRERSFVISFLSLQAGLAFIMLIGVASQGDSDSIKAQSYWFQGVLGLIFLVVMPMRGIAALSEEIRQNTLETVLLTRLSAWSIALGKWTALVFQGFLIASAVLPYVIMRFLLGGEEIIANLAWLLIIFCAFLLLSLATISISAIRLTFVRYTILVGFAFATIGVVSFIVGEPSYLGGPTSLVVWGLVYLIFAPFIVLDLVSAAIAPAAENRTVQRRVKAILFLAVCYVLVAGLGLQVEALYVGLALYIGLCFLEVSQTTVVLRRHVEPFARWGLTGRVALFFGLPGWQSGLLYSMVALPVAVIVVSQEVPPPGRPDSMAPLAAAFLVSCLGSMLVPLLLSLAFPKMLSARAFLFICYNAALAGLLLLVRTALEVEHGHATDILAFLPSLPTLAEASDLLGQEDYLDDRLGFVLKGGAVDLILLSIVAVCGTNWIQDLTDVWPGNQKKTEEAKLEDRPAA
jgi:hypothetical protein